MTHQAGPGGAAAPEAGSDDYAARGAAAGTGLGSATAGREAAGHRDHDPGGLDPTGELRKLAGDCVHCGFCLPACPTYQLWGEEMDSPRGRIHLMTQLLDGEQAAPAAAAHIDRCLGCMACVPACPSGVRYDRLIEAARTWSEEPPAGTRPLPPRTLRDRATRAGIFQTFPYPARMRLLLGPLRLAQRAGLDRRAAAVLPPELSAALTVAPKPRRRAAAARGALPELVPARGGRRAVVGMLTGCVQQVFFPDVNAATARVLAREGCDVVIPRGQGCCGALSGHAGRHSEAVGFARRLIAEFESAGVDAIVVNSAGCGSAMKEYADLLAGDDGWAQRGAALSAKVADLSEFLARLGPAAERHPLPLTAAYHDACHLGHAQRITRQPRDLLRAIPELKLAEIAEGGMCCGSAGIYNLVQPAAAADLGARKAGHVMETGADLLVSANPGCALQISAALAARGAALPMVHIAQVLDASLAGRPASGLLA